MRPLLSFRLTGIPVRVRLGHVLAAAGCAFASGGGARGLVTMAVVSASILWHELGHALTMRALGYPPSIDLVAMGGLTHWSGGTGPSPREALLVSAAGPGAQLALAGALLALRGFAPSLPAPADAALATAILVNVGWGLFNLLPIPPLDGAQILAALRQLRSRGRSGRDGVPAALQKARLARSRGNLRGVVDALLPAASVGALPEDDLAALVAALIRTGREADLVELVRSRLQGFARRRDAEPLAQLAHDGLCDADAHEEAAAVAQLAFQQLAIAGYAYDAALHLVALDRHEEAMAWLRRAADAGLSCGAMMLSDPGLEPLRGRADFLALASEAGGQTGAA